MPSSPRDRRPAVTGVLAVDQSIDECRFGGILATTEAGIVHVAVAFVAEAEDAMWAEVVERMTADRRLLLAVGASLEVHVPADLVARSTTFGTAEIGKWTNLVKGLIVARKLTHDGSRQLAEQVNRAVAVRSSSSGLPTLSAQLSSGPIELARCMVAAVALASKPPSKTRNRTGAVIGVSR